MYQERLSTQEELSAVRHTSRPKIRTSLLHSAERFQAEHRLQEAEVVQDSDKKQSVFT